MKRRNNIQFRRIREKIRVDNFFFLRLLNEFQPMDCHPECASKIFHSLKLYENKSQLEHYYQRLYRRQAREVTWAKISVWWYWSYKKLNISFLAPRNKPFCRVFTNATEYATWDFKQFDHYRDNCWSLLGTFWVGQPRESSGLSWELRCDSKRKQEA